MSLPRANHKAPPLNKSTESHDDNELRYRGEVERAMQVVDTALRQAERRISELEARVEALEGP